MTRGCPIPAAGDVVTRAICLPDTWLGLVSELLIPPTQLSFWDDSTSLEDREVAQRQAESIVGKFLSSECVCGLYEPGTLHQVTTDFTIEQGDWILDKGTLEAEGAFREVFDLGAGFYRPWLILKYNFLDPVIFVRLQTFGASRFTFPGENSQTFPNVHVQAYKNGTLYDLASYKAQWGLQAGASPYRIDFGCGSLELCSGLSLAFDGGTYDDEGIAASCEALVESIQIDYYDPL